ncbi:hypothetical protein HNO86_07130 [Pseudomonas sp. C1C7]|nr:hypothetical protein [Pseudomonas sp. C1C7]
MRSKRCRLTSIGFGRGSGTRFGRGAEVTYFVAMDAVRHYDRAVRREKDVKHLARYVVANPIRAGLVERVHDYPLWDACWL